MGEAKNRGTYDERVQEAMYRPVSNAIGYPEASPVYIKKNPMPRGKPNKYHGMSEKDKAEVIRKLKIHWANEARKFAKRKEKSRRNP